MICKLIDMSGLELEIGLLQMHILWLLNKEPTHGYDLMKKLTKIKKKEITQGALYPALRKLEEKGLIKVKKEASRGKKIYAITEEGRIQMDKACRGFCEIFSGIYKDFTCACCPELDKDENDIVLNAS